MKILAIDDNQDNLTTLKAVLADCMPDLVVLTALRGALGIEIARNQAPDVILLDIIMPEMDGYEVCRRLKSDKDLQIIPVVFLTALRTDRESRVKALETGAEGFLSKPFDEIELTAQIKAMAKIKQANLLKRIEKQEMSALIAERTSKLEQELRERKKAETALVRSESELRTIQDNAPIMLALMDDSMRLVRGNRALAEFMGKETEKMLGLRAGDIIQCLGAVHDPNGCGFGPECGSCSLLRTLKTTFESGSHFKRVEIRPAQSERPPTIPLVLLISTARVHLDGRRHVLLCLEDVSHEKQLEAQFLQAQKLEAIGQLAGGVAHDFNNILTSAMMQLNYLQDSCLLPDDLTGMVGDLEKEMKRAAALTRQLLLFGRREVMQIQSVDLITLLENLAKMLRRLLGEHISLVIPFTAEKLCVEADPGMIEQVITNLCVNARDAMPNGGQIIINTQRVTIDQNHRMQYPEAQLGYFVQLSVGDTGSGMSPAIIQQIFEPFFTTKEAGRGTGLGLATVLSIVKQHSGWVEVESIEGQGSTFRIYLPPAKTHPDTPAEPQPTQRHAINGNETILVVEDEQTVRRGIALALRKLGYTVLEACNGIEACSLWDANAGEIHLLFTDVVMPGGMNGFELAEKFQKQKPHLPVIICSGYSSGLVESSDAQSKDLAFLPKPCEPRKLLRLVRDLLDRD